MLVALVGDKIELYFRVFYKKICYLLRKSEQKRILVIHTVFLSLYFYL